MASNQAKQTGSLQPNIDDEFAASLVLGTDEVALTNTEALEVLEANTPDVYEPARGLAYGFIIGLAVWATLIGAFLAWKWIG
jgi:hypothetical protein